VNSTLKRVLFGMVLVVVGVLVWSVSTTFQTHARPVAFSDFMADVDSGKVEQVTITGHAITGIYRTDKERFRTYAPSQYDGPYQLIERGILVTAKDPTPSSLTSLLYSWAPIPLLIGVLIFFVRQMPRGGNTLPSFGKSKAKLSSSSQKKVTFRTSRASTKPARSCRRSSRSSKSRRSSRSWADACRRACS
jgi:cell division protease FtsH